MDPDCSLHKQLLRNRGNALGSYQLPMPLLFLMLVISSFFFFFLLQGSEMFLSVLRMREIQRVSCPIIKPVTTTAQPLANPVETTAEPIYLPDVPINYYYPFGMPWGYPYGHHWGHHGHYAVPDPVTTTAEPLANPIETTAEPIYIPEAPIDHYHHGVPCHHRGHHGHHNYDVPEAPVTTTAKPLASPVETTPASPAEPPFAYYPQIPINYYYPCAMPWAFPYCLNSVPYERLITTPIVENGPQVPPHHSFPNVHQEAPFGFAMQWPMFYGYGSSPRPVPAYDVPFQPPTTAATTTTALPTTVKKPYPWFSPVGQQLVRLPCFNNPQRECFYAANSLPFAPYQQPGSHLFNMFPNVNQQSLPYGSSWPMNNPIWGKAPIQQSRHIGEHSKFQHVDDDDDDFNTEVISAHGQSVPYSSDLSWLMGRKGHEKWS